jgi:hypothetical protein
VQEGGIGLLELDVQDVFEIIGWAILLTDLEDALVDHWKVLQVMEIYVEQLILVVG